MKFKNVFWGLILIIFGVLLIGRNLDLFNFDWYNFLRLWPVLFILWGISVLPIRDVYKTVILILVLAGSTWFVIDGPKSSFYRNFEYSFSDDSNSNDVKYFKNTQQFTVPYDSAIKNARVIMDAAAGSFYINESTNDLLAFNQKNNDNNSKYKYFVETKDGETQIRIKEEGDHFTFGGDNNHRKVNIQLNLNPVWDVNLNAGASAVKLDLSAFKVRKLDLDGGAGSFKITLGDKYPETHVKVNAGASSITIKVPEAAGCDLRISSVLSGKHISGFQKLNNGHYQTANYDTAKQKITMNVDAAVSSFNLIRY
ncbi:MAG: hypothetical protein JXR71_09155 [Bacteroidales bacterium]|nr:hypothetical protein [Bacteroidales bacterium]